MDYIIELMNIEEASNIMKWQYPKPYDIYNNEENEETLSELLSGSYYSVKFEDQLLGFYCYGDCAKIPIKEAKDLYKESNFLDIGLGLNPNMCNRGLGIDFLKAGIIYASDLFNYNKFRLTVASFNLRAIKVYRKAGFNIENAFIRLSDNKEFYVMLKTE